MDTNNQKMTQDRLDRDLAYDRHIFGVCSGDPLTCSYCLSSQDVITDDDQCTDQPGNVARAGLPLYSVQNAIHFQAEIPV